MQDQITDNGEELPPSKTRIKKDMLALQELGEELTRIPQSLLDQCPVPDKLLDAITEFKRLPNKTGARKRQLQFIGKLMRDVDPEPIRQVLEQDKRKAEVSRRQFHKLEALRDELLAGQTDSLTTLVEHNADIDIQHIRQLIRQARKEAEQSKAPAASRKLFRYLREQLLD